MRWNVRYAIKSYLVSAVWTAPVVALALEQITYRVAYVHQLDFGWIPGFAFNREGTIALADHNIAASIAFIVFTFSSMIVAIQVASGQLSPRIIATALLRDSAIRWSVGLFVYQLLLAIGIKARVDTVPRFLISLMGVLGLTSVIVFMFLIDYAARLLRPVNIVSRIAQRGLTVIDDVYPESTSNSHAQRQAPDEPGPPERTVFHRGKSAVVIAVNLKALIRQARRADLVVELAPRVDDRSLCSQVAFGRERTLEQDSTFAFRVIVDAALKALSAAINDPTTAVIAIDQLQRLLHTIGNRRLQDKYVVDAEGRLRVKFRTPTWNDFVVLSFNEIRQYGAANVQVARRLRAMIEGFLPTLPESRRPAVCQQRELLDRAIEKLYALPEDLELARVPDAQGL